MLRLIKNNTWPTCDSVTETALLCNNTLDEEMPKSQIHVNMDLGQNISLIQNIIDWHKLEHPWSTILSIRTHCPHVTLKQRQRCCAVNLLKENKSKDKPCEGGIRAKKWNVQISAPLTVAPSGPCWTSCSWCFLICSFGEGLLLHFRAWLGGICDYSECRRWCLSLQNQHRSSCIVHPNDAHCLHGPGFVYTSIVMLQQVCAS